jgi:hypothetical protein
MSVGPLDMVLSAVQRIPIVLSSSPSDSEPTGSESGSGPKNEYSGGTTVKVSFTWNM